MPNTMFSVLPVQALTVFLNLDLYEQNFTLGTKITAGITLTV